MLTRDARLLVQNIARHARQFSKSSRKSGGAPQDDAALSETLKLIFNITHYYPARADVFSKSIPNIFKILSRRRMVDPPLQPPVNYLINSLLNLDLEDRKAVHFGFNPVFPKFDQKCNAERLIALLDKAVERYADSELDQTAAPLVTLLRRIYEFAPESVKRYMQWLIMPSDEERNRPLGTSNTLSSRLLRLSNAPMAPCMRENVSSLFFELSDKDATSFVQNVGYGFASGFLMTHNVPIPENAMEAWSNAQGGANGAGAINPITGQRLDAETSDEEPPMTEEEKEQEAERLFVLFERWVFSFFFFFFLRSGFPFRPSPLSPPSLFFLLFFSVFFLSHPREVGDLLTDDTHAHFRLKKTGVVDVRNPLEKALHEGRLEEVDEE